MLEIVHVLSDSWAWANGKLTPAASDLRFADVVKFVLGRYMQILRKCTTRIMLSLHADKAITDRSCHYFMEPDPRLIHFQPTILLM